MYFTEKHFTYLIELKGENSSNIFLNENPFSKITVYVETCYSYILDCNVSWIYKHKDK